MKIHLISSCLFLLNVVSVAVAREPQSPALSSSLQMVVVTTQDWRAVDGVLLRFERAQADKRWKLVGSPIPVAVGRSGMGWGVGVLPTEAPGARSPLDPVKKEGDGRSPAGVFRLGTAFGYAAQALPEWKMPYLRLTPSVECVDDSASQFYNRVLDRASVSPDWHSSEQMLRSDEAYRWGVVVDHNASAPASGGGSCIFLHIWYGRGQGTSGCTAMPGEQLESVLAWLDPAKQPILVQFPSAQYQEQRKHLHWPKLPKFPGAQP